MSQGNGDFETKIHDDVNESDVGRGMILLPDTECPRCKGCLVGLGLWSAACGTCAQERMRACEPSWQVRICVNAQAFLESLVKLNTLQT